MASERAVSGLEIAIVGMAARFPGAPDIGTFWQNLVGGVESIRRLDPEELVARGRDRADVLAPGFVPAHGVLDGFDLFDAEFFGYRPREAEGIDPQQRLFLEVAWEALEDAGCDPARHVGPIAVFAGSSANQYLHEQLMRNPSALARIGPFQAGFSNQSDHLPLRVSYKLDLSGPSVAVQSACSTSLVAVHLACQQLLAGGCDLALAGGVSLTLPRFWGYRYEDGMILSPDGHCRAFDAQARGCLKGDGVGVVVLKRLADALADGDRIDAVILGSASNNDGAAKVGYTAPGLDGQAALVATAHAVAGVEADTIGYIEAHGTGTPLGDPIEIAALTQAFRRGTQRNGFCGIGSVKTNIGHLDAAAGVAGLIKATLALRHATLPASLHLHVPNPGLDLPATPFHVVDRTQPWRADAPRRAGVSSFGIGGTNAHVVLEEPPAVDRPPTDEGRPHLLLTSARTPEALTQAAARLADHLEARPELALVDVAHTLATGRHAFALRRAVVADGRADAAAALRASAGSRDRARERPPSVVFMFPGQGTQYPGMGRGLYARCPAFARQVDAACDAALPLLGLDLRELLLADPDDAEAARRLAQTAITQPALFVVEYALARSLVELGIEPAAMVGHSLGEFVAACMAGVFSLRDALALVIERGRLMQAQPGGRMLAVPLAAADLCPLLGADLSLAAENSSSLCVAAGTPAAVEALSARLLAELGIESTPLHTSHAFHSAMMAPAVPPFLAAMDGVTRNAPTRRFVSSVTGGWADATALDDPQHWARNMRDTVRFSTALESIFGLDDVVLVEVGPGTTLGSLARRHAARPEDLVVAASLRHPGDASDDLVVFLGMLGRLWCAGVDIGTGWLGDEVRRRVALPTYAFQRQRFWIDPVPAAAAAGTDADAALREPQFYVPAWRRSAAPTTAATGAASGGEGPWVIVGAERSIGAVGTALPADVGEVVALKVESADEWRSVWHRVAVSAPCQLVLVAPLVDAAAWVPGIPLLLRALAALPPQRRLDITLVTCGTAVVRGDEAIYPDHALAPGWMQVLPQETPHVRTRVVDVDAFDPTTMRAVLQEIHAQSDATWVAYRQGRRWLRGVAPIALPPVTGLPRHLRSRGVYAISGGLGGMGLVLAGYLARAAQARLLLFGRTPFPARVHWDGWLASHPSDDPVAASITQLLACEALGAEVMVGSADAADPAALGRLRDEAVERFGPVHGLIHAAGVPGGGLIALQTDARVESVLSPKLAGTRALVDCFAGPALDLVVLCSSLTSFVPLIGRSEYTAANLWLDALAQSRDGRRPFTLSINWDNWREIGMARAAGTASIGLANAEGVDAFARALDQDEIQLLVAKRDLLPRPAQAVATAAIDTTMPTARASAGEPVTADTAAPAPAADPARAPTALKLLAFARDLLGVDSLGEEDDFFDHGGDSVVSIQLVARARSIGLALSAKQVFEHRTIGAIARALDSAVGAVPAVAAAPRADRRTVPLTPVQRWFFELPLAAHGHWNLGMTLQTPVDTDPMALQDRLASAVARHEALRLRFVRQDGTWTATLEPAGGLEFDAVDLSATDDAALPGALDRLQARAQAPFDLEHGPLLRAIHAHGGARAGRLFIGVHHLAVDVLALRTLAEELQDGWTRQRSQLRPAPPDAGTPWSVWAERLESWAQGAPAEAARARLARLATLPAAPLPRDHAEGANQHDSTRTWRTVIDADHTAAMVGRHGAGLGTAAALLAALANALRDWSGQPLAWIDVEGHGRDGLDDDIDVTRSVGWFTTLSPVALATSTDFEGEVRQAADTLRAPLHGHAFGLLRHLHRDPSVRSEMARVPRPQAVFLFQGTRRDEARDDAGLRVVSIDADHGHRADDLRSHLFEIDARIADGRLHVDWHYSAAVHDEATIQRLAQTFERVLAGGPLPAPGTKTHAQAELLSFAQERLWFLQQLDPAATVYNKQAVIELDGPLDVQALAAALSDLVARHAPLRTRFAMRDGSPVQLIDERGDAVLRRIEVAGAPRARIEEAARSRARQVFDLAYASPFDAALLVLTPERHWLVLTLHHIITDAWSLQVLVREFAQLYGGRRAGTATPLPPLATSFAEFAQWQRQWLSDDMLRELVGHWKRRLDGVTPLDLPTDRPRPPLQRFEGGRVEFSWPPELAAALRRVGREAGASPFMCLLALWMLLLQRHAGQDDIVVGTPASDRPRVETEGLLGPMVNNLVLRTDLSGNPDFMTLLARVRETVLDANEHRDLPFEKLVEALNPPRDRSRSPLFQVMFAYMNVPSAPVAWSGLQTRTRELGTDGAEFDLSLYTYAPGNGPQARIEGWIEYSTALFDRTTVERLAGHLEQLAKAACAAPDQPVSTLPMLAPDEYVEAVEAWNRTAVAHPVFDGLQALFEAQARRRPDATAAIFDDATLSYAQLDARANQLARLLREQGVAPDDRVAICVDRSSAMLVGLLAILKAGGAYVPVDPAYPADRIAHMVGDSGARVVLTQARWLGRLPPVGATLLCLESEAARLRTLSEAPLPCVTRPVNLAYVIYTSGSTGKPKGVQIEIGAVVNFLQAMAARPGMNERDTLLAVTTISFDIHVLELFVPLATGARVVVAGTDIAADGARLRALLDGGDITAMQATPATWRMVIDAGWTGCAGLKVLCGGEALSPDLAALLRPRCAELWNLYGPTEATVWATIARIDDPADISIGRPFDNMRAYILDAHEQPLPAGVPGELCLGGAGVARGYLDRKELTAERFIANPFVEGDRLYHTGDMARRRADGCIEVLGRLDNQVKLRGHRVELGEVESAIASHRDVGRCVCIVREDRPGDQRMVAYALARGTQRPQLAEIRSWAARELPDYMLPASLVWLDAFPLTPNGKLDRRALPAPLRASPAPARIAASTAAEQFFAGIFCEVLDLESVGRDDTFFDIGGHSLLVMKVVDRVQQRSGIAMHPGELFQQTVGQLATLYGARLPAPPAAAGTVVDESERVDPVLFDGSAGALYGCHHVPPAQRHGRAVLICPPIGPEYARSHRALRQLAARLAQRGLDVMRFDYHAIGDSDGEAAQLSLAQCRRDIDAAIAELRRRSGAASVGLVGLRHGGTLAWQAASDRGDIDALALWDPVVDGAALLAEWRADQHEFATALGLRSEEPCEQVLGTPLPPPLVDELVKLRPDPAAMPVARVLVVRGADQRQDAAAFAARAAAVAPDRLEFVTLGHAALWREEPLQAIVPATTLQAIVDWIGSGR